uniref:Putative secreted peptide n=1 Tax=Anopheles braziliensis TaxID=58242 RepID=A0A2M3ZSB0_9DIPT
MNFLLALSWCLAFFLAESEHERLEMFSNSVSSLEVCPSISIYYSYPREEQKLRRCQILPRFRLAVPCRSHSLAW